MLATRQTLLRCGPTSTQFEAETLRDGVKIGKLGLIIALSGIYGLYIRNATRNIIAAADLYPCRQLLAHSTDHIILQLTLGSPGFKFEPRKSFLQPPSAYLSSMYTRIKLRPHSTVDRIGIRTRNVPVPRL